MPVRIMPPSKRNPARRSNNTHSCTGDNCFHGARAPEHHDDGDIIYARQNVYPSPRGTYFCYLIGQYISMLKSITNKKQ